MCDAFYQLHVGQCSVGYAACEAAKRIRPPRFNLCPIYFSPDGFIDCFGGTGGGA
jgi:hypothetical protein